MEFLDFYYREWKVAEKEGNIAYAEKCKQRYRELVMQKIVMPHNYFDERLKKYPLVYLN